jgi:hypothetical protein
MPVPLKLDGGGEHTFINCTLGGDTVARSAANATVELAGGTARNSFVDCIFPFQTSAGTPLGVLASAASAIDRWTLFKGCSFINNVASTSTTIVCSCHASCFGRRYVVDPKFSNGRNHRVW